MTPHTLMKTIAPVLLLASCGQSPTQSSLQATAEPLGKVKTTFFRGGDDLAKNSRDQFVLNPTTGERLPELHCTAVEPVTVTLHRDNQGVYAHVQMNIFLTGNHDTTKSAANFSLMHPESRTLAPFKVIQIGSQNLKNGYYGGVSVQAAFRPTREQLAAGRIEVFITSNRQFNRTMQRSKAKQTLTIKLTGIKEAPIDLDLKENPKAAGGDGVGGARTDLISTDPNKFMKWAPGMYDSYRPAK